MVNDQSATTLATDKKSCPVCGQELPIFTEDGKHNFCPHILKNVGMKCVCIKCKVKLDNDRLREMETCAPVT